MKYLNFAFSICLFLSASAWAQDSAESNDLTPEQKCERAMKSFGDNQVVSLFFDYTGWAAQNLGSENAVSGAQARVKTDSFYIADKRKENLNVCTGKSNGPSVVFTLYVEPQLDLLPKNIGKEIPVSLHVAFVPDGHGHQVSVNLDASFAAQCQELVQGRLYEYFLDGVKNAEGDEIQKSKAAEHTQVAGMGKVVRKALVASTRSYCSNLEQILKKTAIEQFSDEI